MKRINALFILIACMATGANAQQLFSNGGFENYTSCPTGFAQTNKIVGCTGANHTPEYFNCSFGSGTANTGTGCVFLGAIRDVNYTIEEGVNLILDSPMTAGTQYTVSLEVKYHVYAVGDPSFDYSVYTGCFGLRLAFGIGNQSGRPTIYHHEVDSDATYGNTNTDYHTVSFTFTPTQNYTHLYIITSTMDSNTPPIVNSGCTGSGAIAYLYRHYIDDLDIQPTSSLPIELNYFTAFRTDDAVELNWETLSERNNEFYSVEKSSDGALWEHVTQLNSLGDSESAQQYSCKDLNPSDEVTYYRLIQHDSDGEKEMVAVNSIKAVDEFHTEVYPIPAKSEIVIEGEASDLEEMRMYSMLGEDVTNKLVTIESNGNRVKMNISKLENGVYLIQVGKDKVRLVKN